MPGQNHQKNSPRYLPTGLVSVVAASQSSPLTKELAYSPARYCDAISGANTRANPAIATSLPLGMDKVHSEYRVTVSI